MRLLTRARTQPRTHVGALDGGGAAPRGGVGAVLRIPRRAALVAIGVLVAAASLVSFAESYRALYDWAAGHGLAGPWAVIWPLQVDVFIAVGELALFVALADRWAPRSRAAAWAVTLAGLAVSVAGNVGHVASHTLAARATAAVPPLAAASALAVGLGVLKRVVGHRPQTTPVATPRAVPVGTPEPRQQAPRPAASDRAKARAKAVRLLTASPGMPLADVAKQSGVSERTASRIKSGLPVPLRVAGGHHD